MPHVVVELQPNGGCADPWRRRALCQGEAEGHDGAFVDPSYFRGKHGPFASRMADGMVAEPSGERLELLLSGQAPLATNTAPDPSGTRNGASSNLKRLGMSLPQALRRLASIPSATATAAPLALGWSPDPRQGFPSRESRAA